MSNIVCMASGVFIVFATNSWAKALFLPLEATKKAWTPANGLAGPMPLKPGTGWLIPPCVLHAPGSLVTYEPQWGSDVFGMYQSMVEGRAVPRSLLTKDFPKDKHDDNEHSQTDAERERLE